MCYENRSLVVEGKSILRESLGMQLEALGFSITATRTADEALEVLRAAPDTRLMVVDRNISGRIGALELAADARKIAPDIRVIMTCGFLSSMVKGETVNARWTLLRKPFSWSEFQGLIRDTLAA